MEAQREPLSRVRDADRSSTPHREHGMSRGPAAAIAARAGRIRLPRRVPSLPHPPRHAGRWLVALVAAAVVLMAAYLLWFRDSSFVRVDQVTVQGATGSEAEQLRTTLVSVGRSMSTLNVDRQKLDDAAAGYPVVRKLEITPDFPHGLHIRVVEHVPAALAIVGGARVPVAGDGTVLRGVSAKGPLPTLEARDGLNGDRLADPRALRAAAVAGAAPTVLRRRIEDVSIDSERGLVAQLRDGPELVFGSAKRLHAKWIAAARVLADDDAQGASYIDVRLPGRPAVGGLGAISAAPVTPSAQAYVPATPAPTTSTPTATPATATETPAPTAQTPTQTPTQTPVAPTTQAVPDPATGAPATPTDGGATYTQP
jgi:cell division protein FtsQ